MMPSRRGGDAHQTLLGEADGAGKGGLLEANSDGDPPEQLSPSTLAR